MVGGLPLPYVRLSISGRRGGGRPPQAKLRLGLAPAATGAPTARPWRMPPPVAVAAAGPAPGYGL